MVPTAMRLEKRRSAKVAFIHCAHRWPEMELIAETQTGRAQS
jgi:hypothetical protein